MAASMADSSMSSRRTSPCSVDRCPRRSPRRSARSWTSRPQRRAGDRSQRFRRRAHSGRRRVARRIRRHLSAQHARLRRHPADLGHPRALRRRGRVLAGDHRLHLHGARHVVHVRDRSERREDGHARRRDDGSSSAAPTRMPATPASRTSSTTPSPRACSHSRVVPVYPAEQSRRPAARPRHRSARPAR